MQSQVATLIHTSNLYYTAPQVELAKLLVDKGIRANAVLPGPIWTPLIVAKMDAESIETFGSQVPMKRPGQPVEVAPPYVMLASDESSYISGAMIAAARQRVPKAPAAKVFRRKSTGVPPSRAAGTSCSARCSRRAEPCRARIRRR